MSISLSIQNRIEEKKRLLFNYFFFPSRSIVPSSASTRGGIARETVHARRFKWTLFIRSPCTEVRERTDGGRGCEERKERGAAKRRRERKEKKRRESRGWCWRETKGRMERRSERERMSISRMDLSSNVARK